MGRKVSSKPKPALGVLIFLLLVVAFGGGVWFLVLGPIWQARHFDRYDSYTVVFNQDPLLVVSLDTAQRQGLVVVLPGNVYVSAAHGYGRLPISSIQPLGQLDGKGDQALADTVLAELSLPVSQVVTPTSPLVLNRSDDLKRRRFLFDRRLFRRLVVNPVDLAKAAIFWASLRSDKIAWYDFTSEETELLEETILGDGSVVKTINGDKLDKAWAERLIQPTFRREGLRIGIVNATQTDGLGAKAARMLTSQGVNVISVESQPPSGEDCRLIFREASAQMTQSFLFISDFFQCQPVEDRNLPARFDLQVILAEKFARRFR